MGLSLSRWPTNNSMRLDAAQVSIVPRRDFIEPRTRSQDGLRTVIARRRLAPYLLPVAGAAAAGGGSLLTI